MNSLVSNIRNINLLMENVNDERQALEAIINQIKKALKANVILADEYGRIIYETEPIGYCIFDKRSVKGEICLDKSFNEQLLDIDSLVDNVSFDGFYIKTAPRAEIEKNIGIIAPVTIMKKRAGTLVIYRTSAFKESDAYVVESALMLLGLILRFDENTEVEKNRRNVENVKAAIGTLSFSELEAVIKIFQKMDELEGVIVASKIADEAKITRSVIVNALRKLESAGVVETRSLGMKGTYIRIINECLRKELKKFND